MFYVAVFLGGDWGFVGELIMTFFPMICDRQDNKCRCIFSDFTWQGKLVCMFLCIAGIALYSIPVGTLFDSFGAVVGLSEEEDEVETGK